MVNDIARRLDTTFMFGPILDICRASLRIYLNFKPSFIRKQENSVAHLRARMSLSYASFQVHNHILSCIMTVIINEMS